MSNRPESPVTGRRLVLASGVAAGVATVLARTLSAGPHPESSAGGVSDGFSRGGAAVNTPEPVPTAPAVAAGGMPAAPAVAPAVADGLAARAAPTQAARARDVERRMVRELLEV